MTPAPAVTVPVRRDLVLVGGGHAHVHVLRRFAMRPVAGLRLTLVTRDLATPYSGMLPGLIAGLYRPQEIHVDLVRLARATGTRLIHATVDGLDPTAGLLRLAGRPPLRFDHLSLDIGSTPRPPALPSPAILPVKPVGPFLDRWEALLAETRARGAAPSIAVVGGGVAGAEVALAVSARLRTVGLARSPEIRLVTRGDLLERVSARGRALLKAALAERAIAVTTAADVLGLDERGLVLADGRTLPADFALWTTRAAPAPWLAETGLALDPEGFVAVDACLRSLSHPGIFAAGDVAAVRDHPREKAGVYAVRQGPPLAENLRRAALDRPLRPFRPQRRHLALVGTGDGEAIALRGNFAAAGRAAFRLKDWIDRRWMRGYRDFFPATMPAPRERIGPAPDPVPRCGGCAAKVPAAVLARVLDRLDGDLPRDDAVPLDAPPGRVLLQSVDLVRAFVTDPYRFGRIAAHHALADLYASGVDPLSALAVAVLPQAAEGPLESDLFQMLSGARAVFEAAGARLAGGHSAEGPDLALGFAVTGALPPGFPPLTKAGLRPGDRLVLTKPLGTGVLLAAEMRGLLPPEAFAALMSTLDRSAAVPARLLREHGARAMTDVTGFGLAGHLLEMLRASAVDAELDPTRLPVLPHAGDLLDGGIRSTLHDDNARAASISGPAPAILFDPQTAGGLLAGIPAPAIPACLAALAEAGETAAVIGTVTAPGGSGGRIRIL